LKEGGSSGAEGVQKQELDQIKKDVEVLRGEKKDALRRFQKADRGYNDVVKLYKQTKKEKDQLIKDLESIGQSFEEMQDQNQRLLSNVKGMGEEGNEMQRQRMREKQQRDLLQEEKSSLKDKLAKSDEALKAKEEAMEKQSAELEAYRSGVWKRKEGEEALTQMVVEHRKLVASQKSAIVMEEQRSRDKQKSELDQRKSQAVKELQDAKYDNSRLTEEISTLKARVMTLEKKAGGQVGSSDMQGLLDHYRSKVKCHCRIEDKAKVLPCGHGICTKCVEGLIKDRSRKCPSCAKKFDQSDIRPLYLMGASEMD